MRLCYGNCRRYAAAGVRTVHEILSATDIDEASLKVASKHSRMES
jgi:hypothetical protein